MAEYFLSGGKPTRVTDAFIVEAAMLDAPVFGPSVRKTPILDGELQQQVDQEGNVMWGAERQDMPSIIHRVHVDWGLLRYPILLDLRRRIISEEEGTSDDISFWLWGTDHKHGSALMAIAAQMGRGYVVERLRDAGWSSDGLALLFKQWMDAGRVHKSSREVALACFLRPRAPRAVGTTTIPPPTTGMMTVARELVKHDRSLEVDHHAAAHMAHALSYLVARGQGARLVSIPSKAFTQGKGTKAHPDANNLGFTAVYGRRLWSVISSVVLTRTRGHSAGKSVAEYEIKPEYFTRLLNDEPAQQ